jgi:HEAT repeat protein
MNVNDYRQQVEAALRNTTRTASLSGGPDTPAAVWQQALSQLASPSSSADEKKQAVQALQAGTFLGHEFDSVRPQYVEALRKAVTDPDEGLRHLALDILVSMKDDYARQKLTESLQGQTAPLIRPAAALALLARDDHNSASTIARDMLAKSGDPATRAQAVRVLGSDKGAIQDLADILRNKDEFREVRRASAVALNGLDPERFQQDAAAILSDGNDFQDIKSTVGGALERAGHAIAPVPSGPSSRNP